MKPWRLGFVLKSIESGQIRSNEMILTARRMSDGRSRLGVSRRAEEMARPQGGVSGPEEGTIFVPEPQQWPTFIPAPAEPDRAVPEPARAPDPAPGREPEPVPA